MGTCSPFLLAHVWFLLIVAVFPLLLPSVAAVSEQLYRTGNFPQGIVQAIGTEASVYNAQPDTAFRAGVPVQAAFKTFYENHLRAQLKAWWLTTLKKPAVKPVFLGTIALKPPGTPWDHTAASGAYTAASAAVTAMMADLDARLATLPPELLYIVTKIKPTICNGEHKDVWCPDNVDILEAPIKNILSNFFMLRSLAPVLLTITPADLGKSKGANPGTARDNGVAIMKLLQNIFNQMPVLGALDKLGDAQARYFIFGAQGNAALQVTAENAPELVAQEPTKTLTTNMQTAYKTVMEKMIAYDLPQQTLTAATAPKTDAVQNPVPVASVRTFLTAIRDFDPEHRHADVWPEYALVAAFNPDLLQVAVLKQSSSKKSSITRALSKASTDYKWENRDLRLSGSSGNLAYFKGTTAKGQFTPATIQEFIFPDVFSNAVAQEKDAAARVTAGQICGRVKLTSRGDFIFCTPSTTTPQTTSEAAHIKNLLCAASEVDGKPFQSNTGGGAAPVDCTTVPLDTLA